MTSFDLSFFLSPNMATLGVRALTCEIWGNINAQSIIQRLFGEDLCSDLLVIGNRVRHELFAEAFPTQSRGAEKAQGVSFSGGEAGYPHNTHTCHSQRGECSSWVRHADSEHWIRTGVPGV